jgi:dCMP deaminase
MNETKQMRYDTLYMDIAKRVAQMSYAVRAKVGCVAVKDDNLIAFGFNGMPAKMNNVCEHYEDAGMMGGNLVTNPEVSHAEENLIAKIAKSSNSSEGATVYVTLEPCLHCAKLLYSSGITRVLYDEEYRTHAGAEYLKNRGVEITKLGNI